MAYAAPKLSELLTRTQADIESRLPRSYARIQEKVLYAIAAAQAGNTKALHEHLAWVARQVVPHLSDEEFLLEHCRFWGLWRKEAQVSEGSAVALADQGGELAEGTPLQRPDGGQFVVAEATLLSPGQPVTVPLLAVEPGVAGNTPAGVVLQLVSPVPGVRSTLTVDAAGLTGGTDIEPLGELVERLLFRVQYPPHGGAKHDYERWAREVPGITRAWCYPLYQGGGTVGLTCVLDGQADILPTQADLDRVGAHIDGHQNPVTNQWQGKPAEAELVLFAPKALPMNPQIGLTPDTPEVRAEVTAALQALVLDTEPGGQLYLTQIRGAIANARGERNHTLTWPTGDVLAAHDEIITLGTITWL
ncbi:hypothetical protein AN401_11775 [Zobellella denitrificans]|uniref:Uncharacterized protein n=1 Tax=Zobellella denitrificans TaxID=347534 RepID=A0A291HQI2_9GAMM|nr:baseplate J/gp47 family protein [Zobellella denitrificans]ATG74321.1 hypothetical protein AN401_10985 [Zobellella denitrificans]ATG74449.1 hypothetical protein AN401_11775 [Zobellella denitrificans]